MPRKKIMHESEGRRSESPGLAANPSDSSIMNPARIYSVPQETRYLDPTELAKLERAFRSWATASSRPDISVSRKRILLIFLLIRYTGARLNEVLALDLHRCVHMARGVVRYRDGRGGGDSQVREVQISSDLVAEIRETLDTLQSENQGTSVLTVDAGHVRRKFYERAVACGFPQDLGSPNAIRKARAVELMQNNMPLPVVQRILGHSTPNLTASLIAFSEEDMSHVARHFVEKEGRRKTSARNTFFGKIERIRQGDIQSQVELITLGGDILTTVITNNSLKNMGLKVGSLVTAEIKAPWVILQKAHTKPSSTAENVFQGIVVQILRGKLTSEFIVRIQGGTELCSLVTEESRRRLGLKEQDKVWAVFNSFSVILRVD
jgi:molybdate transport system regulatory protein